MRCRFLPHIAFQVNDRARAVEFYEKTLGMSVLDHGRQESRLACGDTTFYVEESQHGETFLAFEVEDLEAARAELLAANCHLSPFTGEGYMVTDPYGLKFFLSEIPK